MKKEEEEAIADLCAVLYKYVVQLVQTVDAKLKCCQSKDSCWLRKWLLSSCFDNISAIAIFRPHFNQTINKQISNFEKCFTPKAFIYFFLSKCCCHCQSCVFQLHVCKLCFKYVGFNFQYCVFNNFIKHLTANRLRYNVGKITEIFFLNFSKTRDKI